MGNSIKKVDRKISYLIMNNLTSYELNLIRALGFDEVFTNVADFNNN